MQKGAFICLKLTVLFSKNEAYDIFVWHCFKNLSGMITESANTSLTSLGSQSVYSQNHSAIWYYAK